MLPGMANLTVPSWAASAWWRGFVGIAAGL
jgi:hypothetical protein